MLHLPEKRIGKDAVYVWAISGGLSSLFFWLIPFFYPFFNFDIPYNTVVLLSLWFLVIVHTLLQLSLIPYVRHKRWRYEIDEKEIQLRYGLLVITNTLIPVKRVQHVDTRQGPLESLFDMASVRISTAASVHVIPLLDEKEAEYLRDQISKYARLADEQDL
jgi:uncharacterized protein